MIIFISNLYPNSREPGRGLFNMHLMEALRAAGHEIEVIAPVAYFPGRDQPPPQTETWHGIPVYHPRYLYTPGLLIHHHWRMYRKAVTPILRARIQTAGTQTADHRLQTTDNISHPTSLASRPPPIHVILGFIYPDAVAMDAVCRAMQVPYSVRVSGSDFRIRMQQPRFRPLVLDTLRQAPRIFCPGQALKQDMQQAGIDADKILPFLNGIDPAIFYAGQTPRRNEILFAGNLVSVKAPGRLLEAFHDLADLRSQGLRLVIVGAGPLRKSLERVARKRGLAPHEIEWTGPLPQITVGTAYAPG
jgi:teichuronic acid biosynthesis glycosyltransferase TuaC